MDDVYGDDAEYEDFDEDAEIDDEELFPVSDVESDPEAAPLDDDVDACPAEFVRRLEEARRLQVSSARPSPIGEAELANSFATVHFYAAKARDPAFFHRCLSLAMDIRDDYHALTSTFPSVEECAARGISLDDPDLHDYGSLVRSTTECDSMTRLLGLLSPPGPRTVQSRAGRAAALNRLARGHRRPLPLGSRRRPRPASAVKPPQRL